MKYKKDIEAIVISCLFVLLTIGSMWTVRKFLKIKGDVSLTAVVLIPPVVYAIVSDRLKAFKGPGGIEATFSEVANKNVSIKANSIESSDVRFINTVVKEGAALTTLVKSSIDESEPTVLCLRLGENSYSKDAVKEYINSLNQFRNFKFVVFRNLSEEVEAYITQWELNNLLDTPGLGNAFIEIIKEGDLGKLLSYPNVFNKTVSISTTNVQALRILTQNHLEAIVVVDEDKKLEGVVEREQLLSKMILALASGSSQ